MWNNVPPPARSPARWLADLSAPPSEPVSVRWSAKASTPTDRPICGLLTHLTLTLLRNFPEDQRGNPRLRNLIFALATLIGVLLVAASAVSHATL